MGTDLMLEAGFRVRFTVFVIGSGKSAFELFEDVIIEPFVPVFSTEDRCASAIRERVLVGCRVVSLTSPAERWSVLSGLASDEPRWVEFDPDTEQERVYPACEVLARIPG